MRFRAVSACAAGEALGVLAILWLGLPAGAQEAPAGDGARQEWTDVWPARQVERSGRPGVAEALDLTPRPPAAAAPVRAAAPVDPAAPLHLASVPGDQTIYLPRPPKREDEGVNEGGVHIDFAVRYLTDYVFRGIDRGDPGGFDDPPGLTYGNEDSPNLQFDGRIAFDLGKFPHPFMGVFCNVYDSDPISRFQEIRPTFGFSWELRPFTIEGGNITYIFPERDELNTGEVYIKLSFDDSWIWKTRNPIIQPYAFAAYDYDKYNGWYIEAGVRHDLEIEGTGLSLSVVADLAYVIDHGLFATPGGRTDSGLQHYELGMIARYSLNHLLGVSKRYGTWTFEGYLFYTDKTDSDLRANTQIWGGAGIGLHY